MTDGTEWCPKCEYQAIDCECKKETEMTGKWEPIAEKDLKVGMMIDWCSDDLRAIIGGPSEPEKIIEIDGKNVFVDTDRSPPGDRWIKCGAESFYQWIEEEAK